METFLRIIGTCSGALVVRAQPAPHLGASCHQSKVARNWQNAMDFIPVPEVAAFIMHGTFEGQECINTVYGHRGSTWDVPGLEAVANEILSDAASLWAPWHALPARLDYVRAVDLTTSDDIWYQTPPEEFVIGSGSSSVLPNNVSWTVKFQTVNRGRSFRGRNYTWGLPEDALSAPNTVSLTYADAVVAWYNDIKGIIEGEGGEMVVVSRFTGGLPRVTGISTPVTNITYTDLIVDSQRRRLPGRGR